MRCILHGHQPVTQEGNGSNAGRRATFCGVCGKVFGLETKDGEAYRPASLFEIQEAQNGQVQ